MKKRMELYKKIEKRAMIRKHLEHHKRVIAYSIMRLKHLNSSINLEKCMSNIIKTHSLEKVKMKEFGKIYKKKECQHSLGLFCCWGLMDTDNMVLRINVKDWLNQLEQLEQSIFIFFLINSIEIYRNIQIYIEIYRNVIEIMQRVIIELLWSYNRDIEIIIIIIKKIIKK